MMKKHIPFAEHNIWSMWNGSALSRQVLRQVHWLLGTGGDKPDHSQSLVFHLCELCIWLRLRLTVCSYFTRFFSADFLSRSRILWQATFVNSAFTKLLV